MRPEASPFPRHWWGTGLEDAGLEAMRPDVGTYGRFDFARLPRLPFDMRGDFGWLLEAPTHDSNIGQEKRDENARNLRELRESSRELGLSLPPAFVKFLETRSLHQRIRSNTDCYLDLCSVPVPSPLGGGYLIRFLADSQGCVFWYLFLTRDSADHAVVASPGFYGTEAEQWQDQKPDPAEIGFVAESFEEFLGRFWLENEIWFAAYEKTPMPDAGLDYIENYRRLGKTGV